VKTAPPPIERLGRYRLIRKIGAGGMGDVYEAVEDGLDRVVAVKILREEKSGDADRKARFHAEGRTLAQIHHPNVVAIHSVGETGEYSYLAMEFVSGLPLDHYLLSHPLGLGQLLDLFKQILQGLGAAHEGGIIHRDLKPANIMVDEKLNAKIVDFGVAKAMTDTAGTHTSTGIVMGTVAYLAPEIVRGLPATFQSDIYSLGLVFYFALTGEQPFANMSTFQILERIRTTGIEFGPRARLLLPENVQKIVLRMTTPSPAVRYHNVNEILDELATISKDEIVREQTSPVSGKNLIENPQEILETLKQQNMTSAEYRLIANFALHSQLRRANEGDRTVDINASEAVRIDKQSLSEGIQRFLSMRARLSSDSFRAQVRSQATVVKKSPPYEWFAVILVALALGAWLFMKPVPAPRTPAAADDAAPPTRVSEAAVPVEPTQPAYVRKSLAVGTWSLMRSRRFRDDQLIDDVTRKWEILSVNPNTYTWRGDDGSTVLEFHNPFLPSLKRHDASFNVDEEYSVTGDVLGMFPLQSGTKWTWEIRGMRTRARDNGTMQMSYKLTCKVGARQTTMIGERRYETTKVDCFSSGRDVEFTDTFFYSEEVENFIAREHREGRMRVLIECVEPHIVFSNAKPFSL
jgi:serine/threonine protein kinase